MGAGPVRGAREATPAEGLPARRRPAGRGLVPARQRRPGRARRRGPRELRSRTLWSAAARRRVGWLAPWVGAESRRSSPDPENHTPKAASSRRTPKRPPEQRMSAVPSTADLAAYCEDLGRRARAAARQLAAARGERKDRWLHLAA